MEKTYCSHLLRYKDPAGRVKKIGEWKRANRASVRESNLKSNAKVKIEAFEHYGLGGAATCCWEGCGVDDMDVLTLDHINNDGAAHRGSRGTGKTGVDIYRKLRALGWPDGFQTLCWNHQWKKEILRRRQLSEKRFA